MGRSGAYTANPPEKGGKKKKKTLVLTLGSPPEKGGKNPGINPGQSAGPRFQDLDRQTASSGHRRTATKRSMSFLCVQWSQTDCIQWSQTDGHTSELIQKICIRYLYKSHLFSYFHK